MTSLDSALRYVELGWAVLPLHYIKNGRCSCGAHPCGKDNRTAGKHPYNDLVPHGVHDASKDAQLVRDWFSRVPGANIGIATGEPSGFDVVDLDPRNGCAESLFQAELVHGKLPETATQLTGGGGEHRLFRHTGAKLKSPGKGIDIKSTGGYIIAEPSNHASGGSYQWEGSSDPTEGFPIADAPAWLTEPARTKAPNLASEGLGYIDPQRIEDLRAALVHLDASHYSTWIEVGQALHSTGAPEAFEIWDTWSQVADNYDGSTSRKWETFTQGRGLHVESIFVWARDAGWDGSAPVASNPAPAILLEFKRKETPVFISETAPPPHLLRPPGVLGDVVDFANRTAPFPQPLLAVQAGLALGSVVMGRRYRSDLNPGNWTSLYFVNVANSGAGKNHACDINEAILDAAGLAHLIGPPSYTSDSAITSALLAQPCHISIMDEFGDMLAFAAAKGNHHKGQTLSLLKNLWGNLHGTHRPQQYSTMNLSKKEMSDRENRKVVNPALTLLGMTTPKKFYSSLTEDAIEGGFLNRLIIAQADGPLTLPREADAMDVPGSIAQWCRAVRGDHGEGNLAHCEKTADMAPTARLVHVSEDAKRAFAAYAVEILEERNRLELEGLSEMQSRSQEKAQRVATIVAVYVNVAHPRVTGEIAKWAIDYVRWTTDQTIGAIRRYMTGSIFGALYEQVADFIEKSGPRGLTDGELSQRSRQWRGTEPRMREQVLKALVGDGRVMAFDFPKPKRGPARKAYVSAMLVTGLEEAS